LAKIKALREAGLRAEHMSFSFMKRRVQPLMARDTLGYEYTGDDDTSRMPGDEVDDDDIVDRLARIFKDMLAYTPCPVREGPIRRTREGGSEWEPIKILLEGDGNSNKMNTASNTRLQLTTQVGQAHVATGVPLDLGTNTQPSDPRTQWNTKPRVYRPTPVRPGRPTGQTGPCW
jgi:hypothetical protein